MNLDDSISINEKNHILKWYDKSLIYVRQIKMQV